MIAGGRLAERVLQRADVHLRPVEVGQMQDGGAGLVQNILILAPVAHPRWPTAARMVLIHFGPDLRVVGPIARHLHAARLGVPERVGDVSRRHWMQMHLIPRQPNAVVDEVATFYRSQGRVGVENVGRPLLDCRVRKQPRKLVHPARDDAYGSSGLAQFGREVNTGRAGRA